MVLMMKLGLTGAKESAYQVESFSALAG
jgi:hypothetical protein